VVEGVQYSEPLRRSLENSLKSSFNQPNLRIKGRPNKPGAAFYVALENGPRTAYTDDDSGQFVMEILTSGRHRSTFWFGFVATFVVGEIRKYSLQHASLPVFHDIAGDLIPLFRAEWDELDASNLASKHAQPHWHFVQSPERIEGIVRTLTKPSAETLAEFAPEQKSELFNGLVDCGMFHFAMTSLWEKSEIPPYKKRLFDSDDFPKWFKSLTNYIADQIAYLVSHMPPTVTPSVRVFEG
jgi:hypothetical protein